jgi:ribose 5-phosphate isomerase RpiB
LTYFPKTKEIFDKIENAVNAFAKEAVDALLYWQHRDGTRKDKAIGIQAIVRKPVASIVFKFLEEKYDRETNHRNVMEFLSLAAKERTKFLIEQLSLKDDIIEGVIDEMIA